MPSPDALLREVEFEAAPLSAYEGTDSAVFATAWGYYKTRRETYRYPGDAEGFHRFIPAWFDHALRRAQDEADKAASLAASRAETDRVAAELAAGLKARREAAVAEWSDEQLSARIAHLHGAIDLLPFKSFRIDIKAREAEYRDELAVLEAEADRRFLNVLDTMRDEGKAKFDAIRDQTVANSDRIHAETVARIEAAEMPAADALFSDRATEAAMGRL